MLAILFSNKMLTAGTRLSDRYEILSPIGAGGMGVVYKARDLRLDRDVAIKLLPDHLSEHREAMARFEREAKALAALSHSNILSIFDFATEKGVSYAVTELLKGETLRAVLSRKKLSWKESLAIGVAVADGLAAAHSQGVIHRDLKPENIFTTSDGKTKILDFGLARLDTPAEPGAEADTSTPTATSSGTQAGVVMGTLPYMSPEQLRGQRADGRTDIFSFGCTLFEMLSGARAFSGGSQADIVASVLKEDPMTRGTLPADLPAALLQTVSRCLQKDPAQRFQSAKDLAASLHLAEDSGRTATVRDAKPGLRRLPVKPLLWALAIAVIAVAAGLSIYRFLPARKEIRSLAIMPFLNAAKDPETEYLSDGITESLISSLSQVPDLRVMAHDTVFSYKGKRMDPRLIGKELNVEAVVTGKVLQQGGNLVIYANLVKVADGSELWGEQYNKTLADIIAMQVDISREISGRLRARLTGEEQNRVTKVTTADSEAYQLYLRGDYFFWKFTREDYEKALDYFQQAIDKDPNFALAWAALGDACGALAWEGFVPPKDALEKSRAAAAKALQLDPSLARAYLTMGAYHFQSWDWASAEKELQVAIRMDSSRMEGERFYSLILRSEGRLAESIAAGKRAVQGDPLSVANARTLGVTYYWARQYDKAIELYQKGLELDANRGTLHDSLADVYQAKGMLREAIEEKQRFLSLSGDEESASALGSDFEKYGYTEAKKRLTQTYLDLYTQAAEEQYVPSLAFAVFYIDLGEKDKAFEWLDKAYAEREPWLSNLKVDPQFDSIRSDPRFKDLVRRVGIP